MVEARTLGRWMMIECSCSSLLPRAKTHRNELRESKRPLNDAKQFNNFSVFVIVCFIALFDLFLIHHLGHKGWWGGYMSHIHNSFFLIYLVKYSWTARSRSHK